MEIRINKYLADKGLATRKGADALISAGKVFVNGTRAILGQKVGPEDKVEVKGDKSQAYRYVAYNKPAGYVTHSPACAADDAAGRPIESEKTIADIFNMDGLFPIGRLDKNSEGLIILTNDGRITDRLLNPKYDHEKEYAVEVSSAVGESFRKKLESGVNIEISSPPARGGEKRILGASQDLERSSSDAKGVQLRYGVPSQRGGVVGEKYLTKPCKVDLIDPHNFTITLTEGKKHQIKRMTEALGVSVVSLKRLRIMNIKLGNLKPNTGREINGKELQTFLESLGLKS